VQQLHTKTGKCGYAVVAPVTSCFAAKSVIPQIFDCFQPIDARRPDLTNQLVKGISRSLHDPRVGLLVSNDQIHTFSGSGKLNPHVILPGRLPFSQIFWICPFRDNPHQYAKKWGFIGMTRKMNFVFSGGAALGVPDERFIAVHAASVIIIFLHDDDDDA
jgi:hypothetical protein